MENERLIDHPELKLKGRIYGAAPVQAEGTINNLPFYFWAKYNEWSFAVSKNPSIDPVDIQIPEIAEKHGFLIEGEREKASYLTPEESEKMIIRCCQKYLASGK